LTSLVKSIDKATGTKDLCSFVVFLSNDEAMPKKIGKLAKDHGIAKCVLTLDAVSGPPAYKIAKEADVTVILYNERKVAVNFAFRKGELTPKAVANVLSNLSKITP